MRELFKKLSMCHVLLLLHIQRLTHFMLLVFLYPLKTSGKQRFSDVSRGVKRDPWHETIVPLIKIRKDQEINIESMSTELIRKPYNKTCFFFLKTHTSYGLNSSYGLSKP